MPRDDFPHLRHRRIVDTLIVGFTAPYLQAEAAVEETGAEIFALIDGEKPSKVVLSFDGVRFVSSSMIAQVVKLHKTLTRSNGRLRVCSVAPSTREVLRASRLDRFLDVYDDEKTALAKF